MSKLDQQKIEEELFYLRQLIEFHNGARETMWKGREKELEERMDAMLDYMNELNRKLEQLKSKK